MQLKQEQRGQRAFSQIQPQQERADQFLWEFQITAKDLYARNSNGLKCCEECERLSDGRTNVRTDEVSNSWR